MTGEEGLLPAGNGFLSLLHDHLLLREHKPAENGVGSTVGCSRIEHDVTGVVDIARGGAPWFMAPKTLRRFTVPVVIDESWSGGNHQGHVPARGLAGGGATE